MVNKSESINEVHSSKAVLKTADAADLKTAQQGEILVLSTPPSSVVGEVQQVPKRRWRNYVWDTLDKPHEERKFLFKLDAALLTFASLGYFIKYLDQSNINNAFVSGMKEDMNLFGNQLNYMQTCWTVGYVVGEIPSNILLTRIRPSIWIPAVEVTWAVLTMLLAKCSSAQQVYAVRFLVGLFESAFYPGMQYIIGSWYRSDELAKRSCIFHASGALANMFSGYLMTAVYNLSGRGGLKGWQWLFIMDGVISLPIAFAGFFFIPDLPEITRVWYLNKTEIKLAQRRMELEGRKNRQPYTRAKVKRILASWHLWVLPWLYIFFNNASTSNQPIFAQYLKHSKDPKYSVQKINLYPTTGYAFQFIATLTFAWTSDSVFRGRRWPPILIGGTMNIVAMVSLAIWNIPTGWRWTCYVISGAGSSLSGICIAWANEICTADSEERAIVIAAMNEFAYVFQAWLPLLVWQQVEAPEYRKGFITCACLSMAMIGTAMGIRVLQKREKAKGGSSVEGESEAKRGDEQGA